MNAKFQQEDEPHCIKLPPVWVRIWEKGKMEITYKCVIMLLELFLRDNKVTFQELAAPLRTQACPVCMFKSAFLPCRNSFSLHPVIPL